jgi:dimethylargininase
MGFTSATVDIRAVADILHLKSGIAALSERRLVVIDALAAHPAFRGYELVRVAPAENYAANCVRVNDAVLIAAGYPQFESSVRALGHAVIVLDMSEFAKMDGGLSCLSLRF